MNANKFKLAMGWLAGCEPEVLNACTKAEKDKKMSFGLAMLGAIIFSGFAAAFTGYTIFGSLPACLVFAVFWAGFILAIDRAILVFMDRQTDNNRRTFAIIAVRLLIVFVLGYLNSTMMELKVFEKEIEARIRRDIDEQTLAIQDSIYNERSLADASITPVQEKLKQAELEHSEFISGVHSKISELDAEILSLRNQLIGEIQGRVGSGRSGDGPAAEELRIQIAELENQKQTMLQDANSAEETSVSAIALKSAREALEKTKKERDKRQEDLLLAEEKGTQNVAENNTYGFADRYSALHKVAKDKWFLALMFFLVFFAFESMAIILKLLSGKSEYEEEIQIIYKTRANEQSISMQATLETLAKQYENDKLFYDQVAKNASDVQHAMDSATTRESEILRSKAARLKQLTDDEKAVSEGMAAFAAAKAKGINDSLEKLEEVANKPTSNGLLHKWKHDLLAKGIRKLEMWMN